MLFCDRRFYKLLMLSGKMCPIFQHFFAIPKTLKRHKEVFITFFELLHCGVKQSGHFVWDNVSKNWITSNFLKAIYHKLYLAHS